MTAIPPVLATTAPAPENFRSLRRSIRVMVFPLYNPEAFHCISGSLKPTAAWHKLAPPNWWGRRLAVQLKLLGLRTAFSRSEQRTGKTAPKGHARTAAGERRGRSDQKAPGVSISDASLKAGGTHSEGGHPPAELLDYLSREFGRAVRPNHL